MEIINTIGRRKTAIARIYLQEGQGNIVVNNREFKDYFPTSILQFKATEPFEVTNNQGKYDVKVLLDGGGVRGQAEALALAISRALCKVNEEYRPALKAKGLLMRDPRMVERKKFGQKKARKRFQFSKR
ncbi:MAG TPA: 30S ribosomal protein S9 [Bacteroidales bacterium]|jgi:small subunit ribosomal protein S9|nr:30S ribosomal protein S9 [Bacteroidales bacterium]HPS74644.1 30S ribosomal protein S9 [Bacteroidales bacterium]